MVALASVVAAISLLGAGPATAASGPVLTLSVTGRGWGHCVGMSQWGAYGYAQHGSTYAEILAHYYRGTELTKVPGARIRVLLLESAKSALIGSFSPFVVEDGDGQTIELTAASYRLGPKLELDGQTLTPPLTLRPQGSPLLVNGAPYRGTVQLTIAKGRLRAINTLPLESYVLGVVPREVPSTWPVEALKAQAVAARSYALATRKTSGDFDVYADVRSQVYGGLDAETDATNAAVQATAREVVTYQGKVATTYFFSTSGGRTRDIADAWPGSPPVPYLVAVDDPYDDASPHHRWGPVAVGSQELKAGLKLVAAPVDARVRLGPSGHVSVFELVLADGSEVSFPAGTVRAALGLRSTWFRIAGRLSLRPPQKLPVTYGARKRLAGFARGVGPVTLEHRPFGGSWEKMASLALAADGTFALPFKAERTTDYRLATAKLKAAIARVPVAPRVTLKQELGVVQGTVRPVLSGAVVLVQRLEGLRWTTIAKPLLGGEGAFATEQLELSPGVYRARVAPSLGYAAGVSRTLSVGS